MSRPGSLFGGTLLVAGTCIGGGMLALPVFTSLGGFVPSLFLYFVCWAFMACTGLLYLEVCQWMGVETNIISMAEYTLGRPGKLFAWAIYIFLFYSLTVAYIVGCGNLVTQVLPFPDWCGPLLFVAIFAPIVLTGAKFVSKINVGLMAGLAFSYCAFVVMGYRYVDVDLLGRVDWPLSLVALPVAFTSFGYQGIIPTLSAYFNRDLKKTRNAILLGSFIPFVTYCIWQWLILGIVPLEGSGGLAEALVYGRNAVYPLKQFIDNGYVVLLGECFAFFALTTSFFGVTLGLVDFLADGLRINKSARGTLALATLVFVPTSAIAIVNPHLFLFALDLAGGFGGALLLGLLPVLMVWAGRYRLGLPPVIALPGKRVLLALLIAFILFELGIEVHHLLY